MTLPIYINITVHWVARVGTVSLVVVECHAKDRRGGEKKIRKARGPFSLWPHEKLGNCGGKEEVEEWATHHSRHSAPSFVELGLYVGVGPSVLPAVASKPHSIELHLAPLFHGVFVFLHILLCGQAVTCVRDGICTRAPCAAAHQASSCSGRQYF